MLLTYLSFAKYENLLFDVDCQRISQYLVNQADDKKGIERLIDLLVTTLEAVRNGNPALPAELRMMDPAHVRRERDLRAARRALSQFGLGIKSLSGANSFARVEALSRSLLENAFIDEFSHR